MACDHKTVGSVRRELGGEVPHPGLTAAQQREAEMLFSLMRERTMRACDLIRRGEPIIGWTVYKESAEPAVNDVAWRRYAEWALSEETRGVLWEYVHDEEAS